MTMLMMSSKKSVSSSTKHSGYDAPSFTGRIAKTLALIALLTATTSGNSGLVQAGSAVLLVPEDGTVQPYGVDVSYPIHHATVSANFPWLAQNSSSSEPLQVLGDRQAFYDDFLRSCRNSFGPEDGRRCDETESHRIQMNLMQPPSMVVSSYDNFLGN
jgi:hypothetical protein